MKNIEFLLNQVSSMKHISKKGFAAYRDERPELDKLVEAGYLSKSFMAMFGEHVYRLTEDGERLLHMLTM